jgi:hypothetical protein
MDYAARLAAAQAEKEEGNRIFRTGEFLAAVSHYKKGYLLSQGIRARCGGVSPFIAGTVADVPKEISTQVRLHFSQCREEGIRVFNTPRCIFFSVLYVHCCSL